MARKATTCGLRKAQMMGHSNSLQVRDWDSQSALVMPAGRVQCAPGVGLLGFPRGQVLQPALLAAVTWWSVASRVS